MTNSIEHPDIPDEIQDAPPAEILGPEELEPLIQDANTVTIIANSDGASLASAALLKRISPVVDINCHIVPVTTVEEAYKASVDTPNGSLTIGIGISIPALQPTEKENKTNSVTPSEEIEFVSREEGAEYVDAVETHADEIGKLVAQGRASGLIRYKKTDEETEVLVSESMVETNNNASTSTNSQNKTISHEENKKSDKEDSPANKQDSVEKDKTESEDTDVSTEDDNDIEDETESEDTPELDERDEETDSIDIIKPPGASSSEDEPDEEPEDEPDEEPEDEPDEEPEESTGTKSESNSQNKKSSNGLDIIKPPSASNDDEKSNSSDDTTNENENQSNSDIYGPYPPESAVTEIPTEIPDYVFQETVDSDNNSDKSIQTWWAAYYEWLESIEENKKPPQNTQKNSSTPDERIGEEKDVVTGDSDENLDEIDASQFISDGGAVQHAIECNAGRTVKLDEQNIPIAVSMARVSSEIGIPAKPLILLTGIFSDTTCDVADFNAHDKNTWPAWNDMRSVFESAQDFYSYDIRFGSPVSDPFDAVGYTTYVCGDFVGGGQALGVMTNQNQEIPDEDWDSDELQEWFDSYKEYAYSRNIGNRKPSYIQHFLGGHTLSNADEEVQTVEGFSEVVNTLSQGGYEDMALNLLLDEGNGSEAIEIWKELSEEIHRTIKQTETSVVSDPFSFTTIPNDTDVAIKQTSHLIHLYQSSDRFSIVANDARAALVCDADDEKNAMMVLREILSDTDVSITGCENVAIAYRSEDVSLEESIKTSISDW